MSDIKISETAMTMAIKWHTHNDCAGELTVNLAHHVQLAINEACKPLVEALEEVQLHHEDRFSNTTKEQVEKALASHHKEHGQ